MLTLLFRGVISPPEDLVEYIDQSAIPLRRWRTLSTFSQLRVLKKHTHDIIVDVAPSRKTSLLVFLVHKGVPSTFLMEKYHTSSLRVLKLDLGPGISPSLFRGTVLEVKFWNDVFHLYDVHRWKGLPATDRATAFEHVQKEVIPFFSRPSVYKYDDLNNIMGQQLIFMTRDASSSIAWVFKPGGA